MKAPRSAFGGIGLIVAAMMCFAALDTTTKLVTLSASVVMAAWVRFLFHSTSTLAVLLPSRGRKLFRTQRPGMHVCRGLLLLSCNMLVFFALRFMHVAEYTSIVMLTPLIMTIVAAMALDERVSLLRWLCVCGGLAGTLVVIRPGQAKFDWTALIPLLLVGANTAFQLITSRLARTDDAGTMHLYTGLTGLAVTTSALPFAWQAMPPGVWGMLLLIGFIGTLGHFLLILAYGRAPVVVLTPYLYLQIGFAAVGGWLVFGHVPDDWALAGIALVTLCGVFGTWLTAREAAGATRRSGAAAIDMVSGTFPR